MISAVPFEWRSTNNLAEGKVINYGLYIGAVGESDRYSVLNGI